MAQYRKRQPVEARQLTAVTRQEIADWLGHLDAWFYDSNGDSELYVDTGRAGECAVENDWIVRDETRVAQGDELSILKPSEFDALYEAII